MSDKTRIGWTDATWNPARSLDQPLRWRKPRRVLVASDLFCEQATDEDTDALFAVMAQARKHTFHVLTQRPERMRDYMASAQDRARAAMRAVGQRVESYLSKRELLACYAKTSAEFDAAFGEWPKANIHLGVSVEDQTTADARIPVLLDTPAAVRFVSYEPALGPVDFEEIRVSTRCVARPDWIIVGGESGPRARPCDVAWIRSAVEQCRAAGVPAFVKQLGSNSIVRCDDDWSDESYRAVEAANDDVRSYPFRLSYRSRAGADPAEWPEDLRVQEFPR